jgi:PHD/YefM family antitoxin component YafN of YafNO toxin-antitoxin module
MKVITLQQLEADFDEILSDVGDNKEFYRIQTDNGNFMLIPYEEFEVLKDTYQEWVDEPRIDAYPMPVEYIGDTEPADLN